MDQLTSVILPSPMEKKLISVCLDSLPHEACGILYGDYMEASNTSRLIVTDLDIIRNQASHAHNSFAFHPEDWVSAYYHAQKNQREIVGLFHSHPLTKAVPSQRDLQGSIPWHSYWIISLAEEHKEIAVYRRDPHSHWIRLPLSREL